LDIEIPSVGSQQYAVDYIAVVYCMYWNMIYSYCTMLYSIMMYETVLYFNLLYCTWLNIGEKYFRILYVLWYATL